MATRQSASLTTFKHSISSRQSDHCEVRVGVTKIRQLKQRVRRFDINPRGYLQQQKDASLQSSGSMAGTINQEATEASNIFKIYSPRRRTRKYGSVQVEIDSKSKKNSICAVGANRFSARLDSQQNCDLCVDQHGSFSIEAADDPKHLNNFSLTGPHKRSKLLSRKKGFTSSTVSRT